jgi:hypothetical protein
MSCTIRILGLICLIMGIGMVVGIIVPCNTFVLAVILIVAGVVILMQ